jgi:hypothetical protein
MLALAMTALAPPVMQSAENFLNSKQKLILTNKQNYNDIAKTYLL